MTKTTRSVLPSILIVGALWGIFEATVGYALHLLPWKIGSFIWFPAAYFFMDRAYHATRKRYAVVGAAFVSAAIKLLNLFSAARVDYVVNPAVSIVLESLAMAGVLRVATLGDRRSNWWSPVRVAAVNTLWRVMYTIYLAVLVPSWMREVSFLRDMGPYLTFILRENLMSTIVCAALLGLYRLIEDRVPRVHITIQSNGARYAVAGVLLCCGVLVQFIV